MPFLRCSHAYASKRTAAAFFVTSRLRVKFPGGFKGFCLPEFHGSLRVLDQRFLDTAKKAGKPVHVWTVNETEHAEYLWNLGATGMISNYPGKMHEKSRRF